MHNSQGGNNVALVSEPENVVGWTGDNGTLTGGTSADAGQSGASLVVTDCVGCHSSTNEDTIIEVGGSRIPIVYNAIEPDEPLAGGNFYWVRGSGRDEYGHNVMGISDEDSLLSEAPGNIRNCGGKGCHSSLAVENTSNKSGAEGKSGCEGCHVYVSHHDSGIPDVYRFLRGHNENTYVIGKEDPDWEVDASQTKHNEYKGDPNASSLSSDHNISAYCKGCHTDFHDQESNATWIRHPSDAVLPDEGEYASYTVYNPIVPVARPEDDYTEDSGVVRPGKDMVMCLSCHRPHGSPYPDILRWDYDIMIAGGGDGYADGEGCFVCHTDKDNP